MLLAASRLQLTPKPIPMKKGMSVSGPNSTVAQTASVAANPATKNESEGSADHGAYPHVHKKSECSGRVAGHLADHGQHSHHRAEHDAVPYDFTPQLRELAQPEELAVTPPNNLEWHLKPDVLRNRN